MSSIISLWLIEEMSLPPILGALLASCYLSENMVILDSIPNWLEFHRIYTFENSGSKLKSFIFGYFSYLAIS